MKLTRLFLNPRSGKVRQDLANCQDLHRTLLSAFPETDGPARSAFGVLFRVEPERPGVPLTVLVQSSIDPVWTGLPEGYLAAADGSPNPAVKDLDRFLDSLAAGGRYLFRLRANPTRKIDTKSGPDGRRRNGTRVPLRGERAYDWLNRKGDAAGFRVMKLKDQSLPAADARPESQQVGWRQTPRGAAPNLVFDSVLFEGELEVTDPALLREAIGQGIGPGKAYGFGLLSLAPLRR